MYKNRIDFKLISHISSYSLKVMKLKHFPIDIFSRDYRNDNLKLIIF